MPRAEVNPVSWYAEGTRYHKRHPILPQPLDPWPLFKKAGPRSGRVQCLVCGQVGRGSVDARYGNSSENWQNMCLGGHPYACICGMRFPTNTRFLNHRRRQDDLSQHSQINVYDYSRRVQTT